MSTLTVAPEGFWMKSHFYREGNTLNVVTYSCIAGSPEVFRMSVDLRPIIAKVVKAHNLLHSQKVSGDDVDALVGFSFSDLGKPFSSVAKSAAKMVNKVGKSKLVSQVGSAVKGVVKSKITGSILAGAAIAFPPVGAPAVAAYAAANAALGAVDSARGAVDTARKIVNKATDPKTAALLKGELTKWAGATVQKAIADKIPLPKGLSSTVAQAMKLAKDRADQAKKLLGAVAQKAKAGDVEALKMARVLTLAQNARKQLATIKSSHANNTPKLKGKAPVSSQLNGFPALLVTRQGRIVPGRYVEKTGAERAVVLRKGKVLRGNFAAVSGDSIGRGHHGGQDFGSIGCGGCSNPFTKPAALR
jgi:hypothetical protein